MLRSQKVIFDVCPVNLQFLITEKRSILFFYKNHSVNFELQFSESFFILDFVLKFERIYVNFSDHVVKLFCLSKHFFAAFTAS